jgi:TPR repeat protein
MRGRREISRLKAALRSDRWVSLANIAVEYRDLGNNRRAYFWWKRAADRGEGDAWVDVGYCLEHGIGVRADLQAAAHAYRKALRSSRITEYGLEEAHYRAAVLLLKNGVGPFRRQALAHLAVAAKDGDYPEATAFHEDLVSGATLRICSCRRGRLKRIRGQAACTEHPVPGRRLWAARLRSDPRRGRTRG